MTTTSNLPLFHRRLDGKTSYVTDFATALLPLFSAVLTLAFAQVTVLYAADAEAPPITSATLKSTPGAGGNWYGAVVVLGGNTYEASFAPADMQGTVRINGRESTLPTAIVR